MATTLPIPLTTLPAGSRDFGPAAIPDGDSKIVITIDRTVTNGLNSQPVTTQIVIRPFQSNDGGVTWQELASGTAQGGPVTRGTTSGITVGLWPGTSRQIKSNLTVSGSSVAVSGTVTTL